MKNKGGRIILTATVYRKKVIKQLRKLAAHLNICTAHVNLLESVTIIERKNKAIEEYIKSSMLITIAYLYYFV